MGILLPLVDGCPFFLMDPVAVSCALGVEGVPFIMRFSHCSTGPVTKPPSLVAISWGATGCSCPSGKLSQPSDEFGQLVADGFGSRIDDGGGQLGVGKQGMFLGGEVSGFVEQGILGQFAFVILHELVQLLLRNHVIFFHRALQPSHNSCRSGEARHASQRRFFNVCM